MSFFRIQVLFFKQVQTLHNSNYEVLIENMTKYLDSKDQDRIVKISNSLQK